MKKTILFLTLTVVLNITSANQFNNGYIGYMWSKSDEKPIVLQFIFRSKDECEKQLKALNEITEKTIKISRKYECTPIISKIDK